MTDSVLEVVVTEDHRGVGPPWVASARGVSVKSEHSAKDAVAALIEQLLKMGVITHDEADTHQVAGPDPGGTHADGASGRLLNQSWRRRSRFGS